MPLSKAKNTAKLNPAWRIGQESLEAVWKQRKHFLIVLFFYVLVYVIIIAGAGTSSVNLHNLHGLGGDIGAFGSLIGSLAGANSPLSGAYQLVLFISLSLVIIWSLKAFNSRRKITVRDAIYKSSTPLIPFFLILLVIGLEFLPLLIAAGLYNIVITNGVAVGGGEKAFWFIIFILLALLSLFFVTSSSIALYIVSTSDTRPMKALKMARVLVKRRRVVVFGKLLFMPLTLLVAIGLIMLPLILVVPLVAQWTLFLLALVALLLAHSYMLNLKRELEK